MRPIRSVSVLMPTWQGIGFLERSLDALSRQRIDLPWDFLAIDSGSADGTWELLGRVSERFHVPFRRARIHPVEFDHGDTRNLLAARSAGDLLVFLTQDAIATSERWLATLVSNFDDPHVAAAYCRNVPRSDADLLTRIFSANDPGYAPGRREVRIDDAAAHALKTPHEKRLLYNFNDVASAVRRELWELHPFPRTSFGEDILLARALLESGYTVVYDAAATVEHSHDYTPEEMRERARIDGRFNAEWLGRTCVASRSDARALADRQLEADRAALHAAGLDDVRYGAELLRAARLRTAAFEGLHEGGLTEIRHPRTRLLAKKDLSILYVVHGFPPDTWAGTEVYTLNLASEMQRRGHRVAILARTPASRSVAEGGPEDFSVQAGSFQGLRVIRMTHRIAHTTLRDSYRHPRAEEVFRSVLAREKPDVVHFQHLLHFSAGIVPIAREAGLATLITCNDYWALCARVQLIRPDGERCEENQEMGCLLCVRTNRFAGIPSARRLLPAARPLVAAAAAACSLPEVKSRRIERHLGPRREKLRRLVVAWKGVEERQPYVLGCFAEADLLIAPSRFLREKMLATGRFEERRVVYSDYGIATAPLRDVEKRTDPQGRLRFGFVGTLVWYKGVDVLVEAMNRLAGLPVVLQVFGDFQPSSDAHHAKLSELARAGNVVFRGGFNNERVREVYAEIDVLVVPSIWYENSPITIHEAFLTRTPVVASGIGGMAELVEDGVSGLHFRVGDPADLARVLRRFVEEPGLASRLCTSPSAVKSIEENASEMEYHYRALACRRRDG
jgi:glycosyltransferase involved in cell wall biosynthesis